MSSYIGKININNTEYPIAQSLFGTCNTTANTATKVVTCADFDTLISGIVINVYFTYANTESSISLNVNSTGNKTVYVDSNSSILWDAGATKSFVYYNNQWRLINPTSVGTTYDAATTTAAGLMSAADKIKLNGITTGASTYAAGTGLSLSGTTFNHTNSITASSVGSSVATSGATLDVPYAKYDAQGHITEKGTHVHTIGSLAASAITSGTFATARIPNLPTSIITSGTFSTARLPVSTSVGNNNNLPTGAAIQTYVTGLGYEANQNAFTTVKVGTTDLVADSKTDTLTITAGNNITLTPTASSDSFSIAATNTTYTVATTAAAGLMSAADKIKIDKTIHQLSTLSTVSTDDQIAIYSVASSATGKSTLENMLTNIDINISEAGLQDNAYELSSIADSTRIYMNIRSADENPKENYVNLVIPMSGTGTTSGWFHAKAAAIQKKTNGGDYLLVGAFPLADTTNGFILDENVMSSATIAAWEAIL